MKNSFSFNKMQRQLTFLWAFLIMLNACDNASHSQQVGKLNLFASMSDFMRRSDGLVLLAQGACLKYIPCAIPDLLLVIDDQQLRFVNDLTKFYFYGFPSTLEFSVYFLVRHWLILLRAFQPAGSTIRR